MKRIILVALIYFYCISISFAQSDSITFNVSTFGQAANDELQPLWMHANEWGKYPQYDQSSLLLYAGAKYSIVDKAQFSLSTGIGGILNADIGESFMHEFYLRGKAWFFDFSFGMQAYSPTVYNDQLSSGLFITNSNARPVPRINIGIHDYLPLGFTNNWVEVRGGISQGWLNDDRGSKSNSANDVLLHEKFAYIRLGNVKVQPYAGLIHSALFGGTRANGDKIPIDFWATFTASGSAKLGGGEETNAAGAHMGLWDFGFYFPLKEWTGHFYYQKPFADGSGMKLYNGHNKDHIMGVLIQREGKKSITGFSLEWIKTDWQSGKGIPDPLYPVDYQDKRKGQIIWMRDIEDDYDGFMSEVLGQSPPAGGWTEELVKQQMETELNEGYAFGGRDDYMNNGMYYSGWTYHGASMGTPLYHTASTVQQYALDWAFENRVAFINNRVKGFHMGIDGWMTDDLNYRLKGTFTNNYGSYGEEYLGRSSWEKSDNYYFEEKKTQYYLFGEVQWQLPSLNNFSISCSVGCDFGDLYQSVSGRLGVIYKPSVKW